MTSKLISMLSSVNICKQKISSQAYWSHKQKAMAALRPNHSAEKCQWLLSHSIRVSTLRCDLSESDSTRVLSYIRSIPKVCLLFLGKTLEIKCLGEESSTLWRSTSTWSNNSEILRMKEQKTNKQTKKQWPNTKWCLKLNRAGSQTCHFALRDFTLL